MSLEFLNTNERLALIRFCLKHGTNIQLSTRELLRPLVMADLESAFKGRETEMSQRIENHRKALKDYKNGKLVLQTWLIEFLGGNPSVEDFEKYINGCIKQIRELNIREEYSISVYTKFIKKDDLEFHKSMNPKITFGYSSALHEQCESRIDNKIIEKLIPYYTDIDDQEQNEINESSSYGHCMVGSIYYEDLIIWKNDKQILSIITHERMFDLCLSEDDLYVFAKFENLTERNERIIKLIKAK